MMTPGMQAAIDAAAQASVVRSVYPGRVVHIDGDYLAYFCAGGDDMPVGTARHVARDRIHKLTEVCGAVGAMVHLTDDSSDKGKRYAVATVKPYQGNRSGKGKPKNWAEVREFLMLGGEFSVALHYDREADDGMGLASQRAVSDGDHTLCAHATRDKDMRMLPGLHIDWQSFAITEVAPDQYEVIGDNGLVYGKKWFWLQMLQGDTTDNIPGLEWYRSGTVQKKVGDVTATKLLAGCSDNVAAGDVVLSLYRDTYGDSWADRFIEQAALLWLRRDTFASLGDFRRVLPSFFGEDLDTAAAYERLQERVYHATAKAE